MKSNNISILVHLAISKKLQGGLFFACNKLTFQARGIDQRNLLRGGGGKNVFYPTTPKLNIIETPNFACRLVLTKIFYKNWF